MDFLLANPILSAVLVVSVLGVLAGIVLTLASHFMAVETDETVANVRAVLPGANCGACGYAGCDEYAEKVATGEAKTTLCTPGGQQVATDVAAVMGVEAGEVRELRGMVRCGGRTETQTYVMDYQGPKSCKACNAFYQGRRSCSHGCLGFADCVLECKFDAIYMVDGVAYIDPENCTGCGMCAEACPNHLIYMVPKSNKVCVACASHDKGAQTRKMCSRGCIGCLKCQKICKFGAIAVDKNLAVVDSSLCTNCGECVDACPTKCIRVFA